MKKRVWLLLPMLLTVPLTPLADPWKHENGHGKTRGDDRREYKEEYRDGNCKVERKWDNGGGYKEARKCKGWKHSYRHGPHHGYHEPEPVYVPAPVYSPPPPVIVEPGVTIHGTIRIPR